MKRSLIKIITAAILFSLVLFPSSSYALSKVVHRNTINSETASNSDAEKLEESDSASTDQEIVSEAPLSPQYSDEDRQYLIMCLTGECQTFSTDDQIKVGSVIINRVASGLFPNSIKSVCLQRGQYSCFRDGNAYRSPTAATIAAADYLLNNGSVLPSNVLFQAQRRQGHGVYLKVRNEYLCYY